MTDLQVNAVKLFLKNGKEQAHSVMERRISGGELSACSQSVPGWQVPMTGMQTWKQDTLLQKFENKYFVAVLFSCQLCRNKDFFKKVIDMVFRDFIRNRYSARIFEYYLFS